MSPHPAAVVRRVPDGEAPDLRGTEPMLDSWSRSGARPSAAPRSTPPSGAPSFVPTRSGEYLRIPTRPLSSRPAVRALPKPDMSPSAFEQTSVAPLSAPARAAIARSLEAPTSVAPGASEAPPRRRSGTSFGSVAFLVLSTLALAGALAFGWTTVTARHVLLVDNAYDVPITVRAGVTDLTVPARSTATVRIGAGSHELVATGPDGSERYVLDLPETRPGRAPRTAVFNVGGKGSLAVVGVGYGGVEARGEPRRLDEGRVIILPEVPGAAYGEAIDATFPREARLYGGAGTLLHVCHVAEGRSGCALE